MPQNERSKSILLRIWSLILSIGPAIFLVGGTIGTGSVTAMTKSGSQFGTQLLWVVFISCFFSWILTEAFGRFTLVTGETALHGFKTRLKGGKLIAFLAMAGSLAGMCAAIVGIMGLLSNLIYELMYLLIPGLDLPEYATVLVIAILINIVLYIMVLVGRYTFFEKVLVFFVSILAFSFLTSMFIVFPPPQEIISGFIPRIPDAPEGKLIASALVGTSMAGQLYIVRSIVIKMKGWKKENIREHSRDAFIGPLLTFIISGSIMVAATGALFHHGKTVTHVLDMMQTLVPIAGKYAMVIFMLGTLSAGITPVFSILIFNALVISDYRTGELDTRSSLFRIITAISCLIGLVVPILGFNPITAQIASQVSMVFMLPLVIGAMFVLVNSKKNMGEYKAGPLLNFGMITAFVFSCFISFKAILAVVELIGS